MSIQSLWRRVWGATVIRRPPRRTVGRLALFDLHLDGLENLSGVLGLDASDVGLDCALGGLPVRVGERVEAGVREQRNEILDRLVRFFIFSPPETVTGMKPRVPTKSV